MPSHKIHLSIANEINKVLKMDNDLIMLGSVLPDLTSYSHKESHYQNGKYGIEGVANPDIFLRKYRDKLDNPLFMGYLIHLLTDKFYNTYFFKNYYIYSNDNIVIGLKINNVIKEMNACKANRIKQNDNSEYDKYLLINNHVSKFNDLNCYKKVVKIDKFDFNLNTIKDYIIKCNKDINKYLKFNRFRKLFYKPKLILQDVNTMNNVYNDCIKYIFEYLKDIKINNK